MQGGSALPATEKTHVRSDPACRFYGASDKETRNVAVMSCRQKEPSQSSGGAGPTSGTPKRGKAVTPKPSLDNMTTFHTGKKRLGLLFHPSPLDKWIGRKIQHEETTGKFRDENGGVPERRDGRVLQQLFGEAAREHKLGKAADKLIFITDKYLPKITDETRAFIMRFPHRIPQLLKQARQVRKKAKTRLARGGRTTFSGRVKPPKPENQTGRTSRRATSTSKTAPTAKNLREATDAGKPASMPSLGEAASHPEPQDEQGQELMEPTRLPLVGETAYHYVQPVLPDFEADVDWGGSDSEVSSDSCTTTCAMEGEVPRPEMGARQPRTPSYKPRRQASLGAQRPRTPSRSPQRQPVRLVPNQRWREVQQVQAHMARQRHAPHTRTTSSERDGGI